MPRDFEITTLEDQLLAYQAERSAPDWQPVRLGFGTIDTATRGVSPGQVLGIAARTAVGKTWLLQSVEHNFTARRDAGCLSLTLEMPGPEWAERAVAIFEDVAPETVETWARKGELIDRAARFLERMEHVRLVEESVSLGDLPALIDQARPTLHVPLRLVLIDYLGLLDTPGRDAYERASAVGKGLKRLAKAEKVAVIVAMQVSRAGGDGSEPVAIEMLRDSGVLEESVDFLLGAWQPGRAAALDPVEAIALRDVLRVKVLKSRKGGDGRLVDLRFRPESRRLYEEADPRDLVDGALASFDTGAKLP
jgi:replicative DNA helicase